MNRKSSLQSMLWALLVFAFVIHPSPAFPQNNSKLSKCESKCYQACKTRTFRSEQGWTRYFGNCVEECLDDEDENEKDEDENEKDENQIATGNWNPRVTRPVYPKWNPQPFYTNRPPPNPVVTRGPHRPYPPYNTYRPPPNPVVTRGPRQTYRPPNPVVTRGPRQTYPPYNTYRPPPNPVATRGPRQTYRPQTTLKPSFPNRASARPLTPAKRKPGKPLQFGCGMGRNYISRIIGGAPADRCEFPWMIGVKVSGFFCGGTVVDHRHVLTAAHCLKNVLPGVSGVVPSSVVTVMYGSSKRSQMKSIGVVNIHVHPKYEYFRKEYDVGVITLERDLEFNDCLGPICLPDAGQKPETMDECVTIGWGTLDPTLKSMDQPDTLQKVTLPLVSRDICKNVWAKTNRIVIDDLKICAGFYGVGGKDACKGDSGGPLMCRNGKGPYTEFGIVSFGKKCAEPDWPGVYTNVAHPEILQYIVSSINDV